MPSLGLRANVLALTTATFKRPSDLSTNISSQTVAFEVCIHQVLKGMARTLETDRPDLLIEVHGPLLSYFGTTKADLASWLEARGYSGQWIDGEALDNDGFSHIMFRHALKNPQYDAS